MKHTAKILGLASLLVLLPTAFTFAKSDVNETDHNKVSAKAMIHELKKPIEKKWTGKVTQIQGSMLSVLSSTTTYNVDASSAKLVRRFGGDMSLSEIQTGDTLSIFGTLTASTTNIKATLIRDESLQARNGTFEGVITSVSSSSFVLQTKGRSAQTINVTSSTVLKKQGVSITLADLTPSTTVHVSGVWDRTNSNVTAKTVTVKIHSVDVMGTVSAINGNMLTITKIDKNNATTTFSVDVSKAKFTRKNDGTATLADVQVGHKVRIIGARVTGTNNIIARIVRDNSLLKLIEKMQ